MSAMLAAATSLAWCAVPRNEIDSMLVDAWAGGGVGPRWMQSQETRTACYEQACTHTTG